MSTCNGQVLLDCTLTVPRVGAWVADVLVDTDAPIAGTVDLVLEGRVWRGTVVRGGVELGRWHGRLVGGAGGLASILGPQAYASTTLGVVLGETLREVGEALASDVGDLSAAVARWHRLAAPAAHTIADVAQAAGFVWRVRADGAVWVGAETWAALALGQDLDVLGTDPRLGRHELAGHDALDLQPGRTVTLDGQVVRVGAVEHRLADAELVTVVFEERANDPANRLLAALEVVVRRVTRRMDYHALYPARVVAQDGDGPLDLQPDDPRVPAPRAVPYRSLPGVRFRVPAGTRVLLGYEGGDPSKPVAQLWELGEVTSISVNNGAHRAAREGDDVTRSAALTTWMASVTAKVNTLPGTATPDAPPVLGTIAEGSAAFLLP